MGGEYVTLIISPCLTSGDSALDFYSTIIKIFSICSTNAVGYTKQLI